MMFSETPILCKNCEFYRKNLDEIDAATCYHPSALLEIDYVNGFDTYRSCRTMRNDICKLSAKHFKQIGTN